MSVREIAGILLVVSAIALWTLDITAFARLLG